MTAFYTNVRSWGDNLLYVGYENGQRIQKKIEFSPTLYIACNDENVKEDATCYDGTKLSRVDFDTMKEAKEFIKRYRDCQTFPVYGIDKFNYEFIANEYSDAVPYDFETIRIHYTDIEVDSRNGFPDPIEAKEKITCLDVKDTKTREHHIFTNREFGVFDATNLQYIPEEERAGLKIVHHDCENEIELLREYMSWYQLNYPDILSGWYSRDFDIPYLINRIERLFGKQKTKFFSPWNIIQSRTSNVKRFGQSVEVTTYDMYGVSEIDYLDLYKKYTYTTSSSYRLDYISEKHLGVGKLAYDGTITDLLVNNYQKYVEYNIIDVERIDNLEKKLKFLELLLEVSYAGKVASYNDSLGTVKYWEVLIYNHLREKNQLPELKHTSFTQTDKYEGAFVKTTMNGRHRWVLSFDLTSLYPMIMRQVNIGPETHIDYSRLPDELREVLARSTPDRLIHKEDDLALLKKYNVSMSGNRQLYSKDHKSFFSELMEKFFNRRNDYKKLAFKAYEDSDDDLKAKYGVKQLAYKILINSAYGAIGNSYFQYYSVDNAEAVTVTGRVVIQWIERKLNAYLNKLLKTDIDRIVAIDTDSVYIVMDDLVQTLLPNETDPVKITQFLDKIAKEKIEPFITNCYQELFEYLNNYENHMNMDREIIADNAIWTGKKRYFMNVYDKEGETFYDDPDLKVMGIEVVKSSTPAVCQDKLREALLIILRKDEKALHDFVSKFKDEWMTLPAEAIAFPRGVQNIKKYTTNTGDPGFKCPIHVRGAIVYNKLLKKHNLTQSYDEIRDSEKIKFLYLMEPNSTGESVIAFRDDLHKQFDVHKFIDYHTQFEKAFLAPLESITEVLNWRPELQNDLSDFI